jgi:hypothetical protein
MSSFNIKSDKLIDYTLALQRINAVALPIALQNTLNATVRHIKKKTLLQSANKHFDVKKPGFFKANSGYKTYNSKKFNYNINRLKAEVGMKKSSKPHDKATEQIAHQETGEKIKRSINPLGDRPKSKKIVDILKKKPEVYDSSQSYSEGNSNAYIRRAQKAYRNKSGFLVKNARGRGAVNKVVSIKKRKPTKNDPRKMIIKTKTIASYLQDGYVKLTKRSLFLQDAAQMSRTSIMESTFIKEARKQVQRALKR